MLGVWIFTGFLFFASAIHAGIILDQLHIKKILNCALDPEIDFLKARKICLKVADAVIGEHAAIKISSLDTPRERDAVTKGRIELVIAADAFLAEHKLMSYLVYSPMIMNDNIAVMVPQNTKNTDIQDKTVCLMIGSNAHREFEKYVLDNSKNVIRLTFQENIEMLDAYNVGRCSALVEQRSNLEKMQFENGINGLKSYIVPAVIGNVKVRVVTPNIDGDWVEFVSETLADSP